MILFIILLAIVGLLAWHIKQVGVQATWSSISALAAAVVAAIVAFAQSFHS